ncbi:VOC family protein [Amycolatopsis sp. cmx-4-83]|uniref:VOC family protein n=1 Tax=Amycolatopsis sp. cmx-4-83 TaxID=2790940 RepID=UPI00397B063E
MSGAAGGGVRRFEHVGVIVDDLEAVTAFFADLGFEVAAPMRIEDEWVERILGLEGVRLEMVMVNAPDGSGKLELTKFHHPVDPATDSADAQAPAVNRLGFRHIAYIVGNLDSTIERIRAKGLDTIGEIVNYENIFRMCYVRGPEGLIVELAEESN